MYIYIYGVVQVFKQHVTKIIRILNSIENEGQLECAKTIISNFVDYWKLNSNSSVLDVGCAKGFMLYDIKKFISDKPSKPQKVSIKLEDLI